MILLASFLGPLCAFFIYNRPPARIYLGDAGSLFIGGFLGTVPFLFDWGTYNWYGYLTPIIILGIPLLECVSLIVIRSYKGIPFYQGSPDHFSCYLINNGWYKTSVLWYVSLLSIFLGGISLLFSLGIVGITNTIGLGLLFLIVWIAGLHYKF
jgi:UDP-GlcNAc:undecaprenyl-phosphate GlcNAc-1-phosphate transferase